MRSPVPIWPAGSALPVAGVAEPAVVQRSTAEEGAPSPRRIPGTANRKAASAAKGGHLITKSSHPGWLIFYAAPDLNDSMRRGRAPP